MTRGSLTASIALAGLALPAAAQIVDVRQGTNISVAVDPTGESLVVDLLGGLWRLPATGGGATMLMAPGSGISQPRFAPDGTRLVVERREGNQWDLWLLELGTGTWTQLTETSVSERHPDFLADGSGIVFGSDRTGKFDLWLLDLRNDALRQLTDEPGASAFPAVADDGTIAYSNRERDTSSIRVLEGGPVGRTLATSSAIVESPSWRPGGRVLVYNVREPRLRSDLELLIDADVDVQRTLTDSEDVFVGRVAWLGPEEFVYAADGQLWRRGIASLERRPVHMFAGVAVERREAPSFRFQLDEAGPHPARGIRDFTRSADGRAAVFAALGDIWLLRGRSLERLTRDEYVDIEPRFMPGREEIVFASDREGSFNLWRLPLETRQPEKLADEPGDDAPPLPVAEAFEEISGFDELTWSPASAPEPFVVQAGRLFEGVGNEYRRHVDIHVEGQRIVAVVGRNRRPLPGRVIDFSEMTVIPGLIDVHAHHARNSGRDVGLAWLRHGVTTVREVDADQTAAIERSEAWASGSRPGPRLYISPALEDRETADIETGPIAIGSDFGLSSGFAHAINAGVPATGGPSWAGTSGQPANADSEVALSPLNRTYQDTLAVLAGRGSYLSTGLSAALETLGTADARRVTQRQLGSLLERSQRSFGRVAVGSDAPLVPYGAGFHMELEALVRAGVPNAQVLRWATAGGAMALGLDSQLGSIEAGRLADFVVIDGDPLMRIADTLNIEAVVKGGVFVTEPDPARIRRPSASD